MICFFFHHYHHHHQVGSFLWFKNINKCQIKIRLIFAIESASIDRSIDRVVIGCHPSGSLNNKHDEEGNETNDCWFDYVDRSIRIKDIGNSQKIPNFLRKKKTNDFNRKNSRENEDIKCRCVHVFFLGSPTTDCVRFHPFILLSFNSVCCCCCCF